MLLPNANLRPAATLAVVLATACVAAGAARAATAPDAETLVKQIGCPRGLCALVGDEGCKLALDLARAGELTLYVQLATDEDVEAACRAADDAGLYGTSCGG